MVLRTQNIAIMFYKQPLILRKALMFFAFFFLVSTLATAQSYNKTSNSKSYWQINANFGTSIFFGDIKQYRVWPVSNYENEWRFAGGLQLIKQISPVFGIRGQGLVGNVAGTRREWNRYFESNYIEFNLNTTISLRNIIRKYQPKQFWDAYFIIGMGLTNYNTEVYDLSTKQVVQNVGNGSGKGIGGSTLQGIMTGGLGLDFRLSDKINLNLESANRIMNSDDMDGRVSGFIYDVYNYTSIGLSYKLGATTKVKKADEYKYFNSKDDKVTQTEYDYSYEQPLEPPEVDALSITPAVIDVPVTPVVEEKIVKEEPIEIVVVEEVILPEFEYRVQIRAKYGNEISIQHLSNIYNIPVVDIQENTYNGFYIYTVGSFTTYDQAKEKRNNLRSYNGISDAFVVAFKNGHRLNKLPQ